MLIACLTSSFRVSISASMFTIHIDAFSAWNPMATATQYALDMAIVFCSDPFRYRARAMPPQILHATALASAQQPALQRCASRQRSFGPGGSFQHSSVGQLHRTAQSRSRGENETTRPLHSQSDLCHHAHHKTATLQLDGSKKFSPTAFRSHRHRARW